MDALAIIAVMRRRLGEALVTIGETVPPEYSDGLLLEYVRGAALELGVLGITDTEYTVDVVNSTIIPEPSNIDGLLLGAKAVADLVSGDLVRRVTSGEMGIRFRTGVDEISTIDAGRHIGQEGAKLNQWYRHIATLKLSRADGASERLS